MMSLTSDPIQPCQERDNFFTNGEFLFPVLFINPSAALILKIEA